MQIAHELRVFALIRLRDCCSVGNGNRLLGLGDCRIENGVLLRLSLLSLFDLLKCNLSQLMEVRRNGGGLPSRSQVCSPVIKHRRKHHDEKADAYFHTEMMGSSSLQRVITQVTNGTKAQRKVTPEVCPT